MDVLEPISRMLDIPPFANPLERSSWVQSQLKNKCSSFSAIATRLGINKTAVSNAMSVPSDAIEKAIAEELGVTQEALFPERFDSEGLRLHRVKNKPVKPARNVKHSRAA